MRQLGGNRFLLHTFQGDWLRGFALWLGKLELEIRWRKNLNTRARVDK